MKDGYELRFKNGDIVYWCEHIDGKYSICWGMVDTQYCDKVWIDFLKFRERRLIDGIPFNEYDFHQKPRKLPKGWSYNTRLYDFSYDPWTPEEDILLKNTDPRDPKQIQALYDAGILVKASDVSPESYPDTIITSEGFQIVRRSGRMEHWRDYATIEPNRVYFTYKEAKNDKDSYISELKRQAALSDEEWSMEQIAKTIGKYGKWRSLREEDKQQYVDFFQNLPNLADVETRISSDGLEWKYTKNKRWRPIRFPD